MRTRLALTVLALALVSPAGAHAKASFAPCGSKGALCGSVTVPLDYSGAIPGEIALRVEELPPSGTPRGALLLLAGGPGQASAEAFDLAAGAPFWRLLFPGYTLIAYDDRGTGDSGALSCPSLDSLTDAAQVPAAVGLCGELLGPARPFYATRDHADDIDSVRSALGVDKLALFGVSYGTRQALAYALLHPDHVDRIVLDSVPALGGDDPFGTDLLRAIPLGLQSLCYGGSCRQVSRDPAADLARLANRLDASPELLGGLPLLDGKALLGLTVATDLSPGLAAELLAAVRAANDGDLRPLRRLFVLAGADSSGGSFGVNDALYVATVCDDGPFPWANDTPVSARQPAIDAALAGLPPGATGPFGIWATGLGTVSVCMGWPASTGDRGFPPDPLPDVPVLVLAGDRDMRTPLAGAAVVAARFPQGHLLVVPGAGHSVITSSGSICPALAVLLWIRGGGALPSCPRVKPQVAPLGPFPRSLGTIAPMGGERGLRGRTLAAVALTLQEARAAALFVEFGQGTLPGLDGGTLKQKLDADYVTLAGYSDVPGVAVTGKLAFADGEGPALSAVTGTLRISGARAAHGTLTVLGSRLSGLLGGRRVSVKLRT